jgi:hypothetical protein
MQWRQGKVNPSEKTAAAEANEAEGYVSMKNYELLSELFMKLLRRLVDIRFEVKDRQAHGDFLDEVIFAANATPISMGIHHGRGNYSPCGATPAAQAAPKQQTVQGVLQVTPAASEAQLRQLVEGLLKEREIARQRLAQLENWRFMPGGPQLPQYPGIGQGQPGIPMNPPGIWDPPNHPGMGYPFGFGTWCGTVGKQFGEAVGQAIPGGADAHLAQDITGTPAPAGTPGHTFSGALKK